MVVLSALRPAPHVLNVGTALGGCVDCVACSFRTDGDDVAAYYFAVLALLMVGMFWLYIRTDLAEP